MFTKQMRFQVTFEQFNLGAVSGSDWDAVLQRCDKATAHARSLSQYILSIP